MSITLKVELGALREMVCKDNHVMWESHRRGKNWMAVIHKDPTAPAGLGRSFWARARGDYFYLVPSDVKPGDAVEIGADYYSAGGNPSRRRWYGVVVAVAADALVLVACKTANEAINQAEALVAEYQAAQAAPVTQFDPCL